MDFPSATIAERSENEAAERMKPDHSARCIRSPATLAFYLTVYLSQCAIGRRRRVLLDCWSTESDSAELTQVIHRGAGMRPKTDHSMTHSVISALTTMAFVLINAGRLGFTKQLPS